MKIQSWIVATAYALWLVALWIVFWRTEGNDQNALQLFLALGIVPAALQLLLVGVDTYGLGAPVKFSFALLLVVLASYWNAAENIVGWQPVFQVCNLIFALSIATMVAGSRDRSVLPKTAVAFSVISAPILIYVIMYGQYLWGRLWDHLQPNWWGLIGLSVAVAAFGARRMLSVGLIGLTTGAVTMYVASARGSIVGFILAVMVLAVMAIPKLRGGTLVKALVLCGCLFGALIVLAPYLPDYARSAADQVFKLDDPYRGVGTGFTGREYLWDAAIDVWKAHPFLGAGWHSQEAILQIGAHNSYLATMADMGLVGLGVYVGFLAWALLAGISIPDDRARRLVLAVVAAYIGLGFFEARAFSVGQPFSLLFYFCAFYAIADLSRRSAIRRLAPQAIPA